MQTGEFITPETRQMAKELAEGYNPVGMTAVKGFPKDYHEFGPLINQAYMDLKANPSKELADRYKALMEARENAPINNPNNIKSTYVEPVVEDYRGQHAAPTKDSGAAAHDLTGIYPEDFYSFNGAKYYGDGADEARDRALHARISSWKNRPTASVTIYRAIPKDAPKGTKINVGDWITPDREYAMEHGEGALNGKYRIIKQNVKARDIFTNGDSMYEWGYDPQPPQPRKSK